MDVHQFPASTGSSTPRKFCFDIAIMTDKIYEDDETFTVFLRQNLINRLNSDLLVQPNSTEITILDQDGKYSYLQQNNFTYISASSYREQIISDKVMLILSFLHMYYNSSLNAEVVIGFINQIYNVSEDDGKVCVEIGVISGILGRNNITVQLAFSSESAVCESLANFAHTVNAEHVKLFSFDVNRWQRFCWCPWFTNIHL